MEKLSQGLVKFLTEDQVAELVQELAMRVNADYAGKRLCVVVPLKGSWVFAADFVRHLTCDVQVDFVYLRPFDSDGMGRASVRVVKDISLDVRDQHVLILEEVVDGGRSLSFLKKRLNECNPKSLGVVALLDKSARRRTNLSPEYVGLSIDDRFVVGYGMDTDGLGRNYKNIYNFSQ